MDEWKVDVDKIVKAGESYDAHAADLEKILGQKQEIEININVRVLSPGIMEAVLMLLIARDSYSNVESKMSRMTLYVSKRSKRGSERVTDRRRGVWKISTRFWWSRKEIMMGRLSDSIRGLRRSRERFV